METKCLYCGEDTADTDLIVAHMSRDVIEERWEHPECRARRILGSFGHQLGRCSCQGGPGTEDDPPELSKRESAQLAWALGRILRNRARKS